jgi:hypothetical protein
MSGLWNEDQTEENFHPRNETYLNFLQAKKTMEVKREAEKFRVGHKVRLLERKALKFQIVITSISMVCIALAVLVQEITFEGTYSNALGGDWFSQMEVLPVTTADLVVTPDTKLVMLMKFILSALTAIQLIIMYIQFKILTSIMMEQKHLDISLLDAAEQLDGNEAPVLTLTSSFGSWSYLILLKYFIEIVVCAIHPPAFVKDKFVTKIIGRDAIYNLESLVDATSALFYATLTFRIRSRFIHNTLAILLNLILS